MPATGVTLVENDNDNTTCLNSTLTFTGTVADLEQLNGVVLTCDDFAGATDNVTIVIPSEIIVLFKNWAVEPPVTRNMHVREVTFAL